MNSNSKTSKLVAGLLDWFMANARDLPWRRTRDPYAIWVSEIMLQQTQVKTVIPYWERWMRELPTIKSVAQVSPAKLHKLWEGLGYYTRVRNLQKAAQQIVASSGRDELHESQTKSKSKNSQGSSPRFPEHFNAVLALPGIGRYTAGAICSIAFNQPKPILDGNVIRVLTRIFGIAENPREKEAKAKLWALAEALVLHASRITHLEAPCSHFNQSLMELGALVCTPRNPQCEICPAKKLCVAFKDNLVGELPNLGKREKTTDRRFVAFVIERNGKFLVRQRPAGVVNAHLWEFPNVECNGDKPSVNEVFRKLFGISSQNISTLCTIKHSITRYRNTLEAYKVTLKKSPRQAPGIWLTPKQLRPLAFTAAHKKLASASAIPILSDR